MTRSSIFKGVNRKISSSIWKYRWEIDPHSILRILRPSLVFNLVKESLLLSLRDVGTLIGGESLPLSLLLGMESYTYGVIVCLGLRIKGGPHSHVDFPQELVIEDECHSLEQTNFPIPSDIGGVPSSVTWREFKSSSSPTLDNSSSGKSILRETIFVMPPLGSTSYITYPLECVVCVMNTILVTIEPSFPCL